MLILIKSLIQLCWESKIKRGYDGLGSTGVEIIKKVKESESESVI